MAGWRLAIDFGTSNSAAARASDGSVQVVPLSHYGNLMPSAVLSDDYGFSVGVAALHQAEAQPGGFFPEPKRAITAPSLHLAGSEHKVPEVIGAVLSDIIARASRLADGDKPSNLVLTHPEAWGQVELERLIESAEAAGIEWSRVSLVSEPRAATYWYSSARPLKQGEMAVVFDLGGGTLDVAVLTPGGQGALQVIAARGDNSLGGRTIDARIRDWVLAHLEENDRETLEAFRAGGVSASIALDRSIRQAKEILSDVPRATITVAARGRESIVQLTRGEFEELIAPDVDRAMNLARATLLDAGIRRGSDVPVYLTGGSSRIPMIQERLSELCRVATLDDPKTVVCRGALMGPVRRAEDVLSETVAWVQPEDAGASGSSGSVRRAGTAESNPESAATSGGLVAGPAPAAGAQRHSSGYPQENSSAMYASMRRDQANPDPYREITGAPPVRPKASAQKLGTSGYAGSGSTMRGTASAPAAAPGHTSVKPLEDDKSDTRDGYRILVFGLAAVVLIVGIAFSGIDLSLGIIALVAAVIGAAFLITFPEARKLLFKGAGNRPGGKRPGKDKRNGQG